jgi:hypothetical protein
VVHGPPRKRDVSERDAVTTRHLTQIDLAARWGLSPRTLEAWRSRGEGPAYLRLGGKIAYRIEDIEAFEAQQLQNAGPPASARGRRRRSAGSDNA